MTFYDQTPIKIPAPLVDANLLQLQEDYLTLARQYAELQMMFHCVKSAPGEMRQTLRYYGGKWKIADWVVSHIPKHDVYLEPCFGSGGVFFTKNPSQVEVISDLSGDVVHFFKMLRDVPDELVRAIVLTPYAESEYLVSRDPASTTDIERARRFYACLELGRGGTGHHNGGYRRDRKKTRNVSVTTEFQAVHHIYQAAARLKNAQLDQADLFKQIARYDDPATCVYIDPPYVYDTRGAGKPIYKHEMTDSDHEHMAEVLHQSKSMFMLSGYPSKLYDRLYGDWTCLMRKTQDVNAKTQTECLWLSPNAVKAQLQPKLFA